MEENTLLIKRTTIKHIFCFIYSKFFLLTKPYIYIFEIFENKNYFLKFNSPTEYFFLKYQKLFLKTVIKNDQMCPNNQIDLP